MPFEESHFLPAIDSKLISILYCIKFCNKVTEGDITECMDRRNSNSVILMLLHFYNVNKDEHNFLYLYNKQTNAHYFREKVVCAELEDLKSDMAEFHQIPNTAVRQTVKEVILTKINILSAKIASLNESVGGRNGH